VDGECIKIFWQSDISFWSSLRIALVRIEVGVSMGGLDFGIYSLYCKGGDQFLPAIVVDGLLYCSGPAKILILFMGMFKLFNRRDTAPVEVLNFLQIPRVDDIVVVVCW
jgi:hypothetical protein